MKAVKQSFVIFDTEPMTITTEASLRVERSSSKEQLHKPSTSTSRQTEGKTTLLVSKSASSQLPVKPALANQIAQISTKSAAQNPVIQLSSGSQAPKLIGNC